MPLPAEVRDLAHRLGALDDTAGGAARFEQAGRMRQDADGRWTPFRATQNIDLRNCAFAWTARMGPAGMIRVRDALAGGRGGLDVTALGLVPIARPRPSPELTRGELMRYLAELAWAPDAILLNRALSWRVEAADRLRVGAGEGPERAEVTLTLDAEGRIGSVFAPDRPRAIGRSFAPTPWRGRFHDYRRSAGRWLPACAEVAWVPDGRETVCWEGRISNWRIAER